MDHSANPTRIIGLTGGIATGKTTVSNYLAQHYQLPILDADLYARAAVQPGSPILERIVDRHTPNILQADGSLDRRQLAEIIFNQPTERAWLEQQIHPYVRQALIQDRDRLRLKFAAIVLVVPLLFEAQMTDLVTEIWVVSCPKPQQIDRLMQRESLSFDQAKARIHSQMPIAEKCDRADVILQNSSTQDKLLEQVDWALGKQKEGRS
jgi:dephospho-CoA kinase